MSFRYVAAESLDYVIGDPDRPVLVFVVLAFEWPHVPLSGHRRGDGDGGVVEVYVSASEGECFSDAESAACHQVDGEGGTFVYLLGGFDHSPDLIIGEGFPLSDGLRIEGS